MIDFGAKYYFIIRSILERLRLKLVTIPQIDIEMPNGDRIHSSNMLIGEMISQGGQKMVVDLMVMDMLNFDVILDIDFFNRYGAEIEYKKKKAQFSLDSIEQFYFGKVNFST